MDGMDGQAYGWMGKWMGWMDRRMDGWVNGWDGWTDRWTDGRVDEGIINHHHCSLISTYHWMTSTSSTKRDI